MSSYRRWKIQTILAYLDTVKVALYWYRKRRRRTGETVTTKTKRQGLKQLKRLRSSGHNLGSCLSFNSHSLALSRSRKAHAQLTTLANGKDRCIYKLAKSSSYPSIDRDTYPCSSMHNPFLPFMHFLANKRNITIKNSRLL